MNFPTIPTIDVLADMYNDVYDTIKFCQNELMVG